MRLGIVGAEAAKFTAVTEAAARRLIREQLIASSATMMVSGGCHLGGVDIYAEEEVKAMGLELKVFKPKYLTWHYYRERNISIAAWSNRVICITVSVLPPGFLGLTHDWCYHCQTPNHVKSGGCWTVKEARRFAKQGSVYCIMPDGDVRQES